MTDEIQTAISALERAIHQKRQELHQLEHSLAALQKSAGREPATRSSDYAKLGIIEATKRWLSHVGKPQSTREIAEAIRDRGVKTRSRNFLPTVYATLANSEDFVRQDGMWALRTTVRKRPK